MEAGDTPAVDAVLKADKVRWNLLEEEKALTAMIDNGEEDPEKFKRLQEVLDELNTIGASSAEAKARRILFGLGFDGEMQTKVTEHQMVYFQENTLYDILTLCSLIIRDHANSLPKCSLVDGECESPSPVPCLLNRLW